MLKNLFAIEGSNNKILAAGPLSKQPHSKPYRIVLIGYVDGKFSVHHQIYNSEDATTLDDLKVGGSSLSYGHYFSATQLVEATKKFAEVVAHHAEYLESLYRKVA